MYTKGIVNTFKFKYIFFYTILLFTLLFTKIKILCKNINIKNSY